MSPLVDEAALAVECLPQTPFAGYAIDAVEAAAAGGEARCLLAALHANSAQALLRQSRWLECVEALGGV